MGRATRAGGFGSRAAADAICVAEAAAARLRGTFVAYLDEGTSTAHSRLGTASGWVRPDGRTVAVSANALLGSPLYYPMLLLADGTASAGGPVWTGLIELAGPRSWRDILVMPRVLLTLFDGCTHGELAPALQVLSGTADIEILGPTREPLRMSEGFSVVVDRSFAEPRLDGVALVLVPGGDPASVLEDVALKDLLSRAARETKVAAICNGVLLLAVAGVTRERRVTHTAIDEYAPRPQFDELLLLAESAFAGSIYVDEDVVLDGPLLTAKPWAAIAFAKHAAVHAGLLSRDEAASRARYLRGFRDRSMGEPHLRWAIFLSKIEGVATTRHDIEAHVAHLRELERSGQLELAGPFPDHASGLVVVRAHDQAEAEGIAARDPFVRRGVRALEVRRWQLSSEDNDHLLGG